VEHNSDQDLELVQLETSLEPETSVKPETSVVQHGTSVKPGRIDPQTSSNDESEQCTN
ncbi:hypothetical protein Dimus_001602, partial [Dionaea muscipula]